MIKAVILDLDDTLVLTKEVSFEGDNEVLRRLGYPPVSKKAHTEHWGKTADEAVQLWAPGVNLPKFRQVYAEVIAQYVKAGKLDAIPSENLKTLDELLASGKKLYVLTSRAHHEVVHLLDTNHHLAGRISGFYYQDNMKFHKPDPRAFEQIETDHGHKPGECIYVGDSPSDAAAAKGAGLHFIASLESGLLSLKDFAGYEVDAFIGTFPELTMSILKLEVA